ncbi:hypothetical protein Tco_1465825 [Tanacetum coccineum]
MSNNKGEVDQDEDEDLARERDLLASLIEKLKCEIIESKDHNKLLESSNKNLVDKLKSEIEDFKNKKKCLESSNNHFKEANTKLAKNNKLLFKDLKKFQAELDRYYDVNYVSKMENDYAKAKGDLMSYKMESQKSFNECCYNDNLSLMLAPESDEIIRLAQESRSKLSDLIKLFDYKNLNNLYDLFVPQRKKSPEQRYFSERSKISHTPVKNENSKESFNKQTTLLEKRMDESIQWDQKCKSSKELFKIKSSVDTIFNEVERCEHTIAKRTYFGHIDLFIQNTTEGSFCPQIRKINADLEKFHLCLKEEMVVELRYFNSLEHEVDSLKSQLETQKTQFFNEIDPLSGEYYYADNMNAILGVYTRLNEVTNFQCDYLEALEKCQCLENELSKRNTKSKSFEALQQHVINLELALQQCQEQIKNDKAWKEKESNSFQELNVKYFEIQDLKAQLQNKGISIRNKQQVEDHHKKFKFSNNKTSVTACNDSLNAQTSNVNFVYVTYGKCVLNENHDLCVLYYINGVNNRTKQPIIVPISTREPKLNVNQYVATPLKKTVAAESTNQKPRSKTRKQYEHISKTCRWWYPKTTPPGYKWKPKPSAMNAKPNVSLPLGKRNLEMLILWYPFYTLAFP